MTAQLRLVLAIAALASRASLAQARILSAPPEPSVLGLTRDWTRASTLGDLQELRTDGDYLEVRVWAGYGLGSTQGVVLRRTNGQWSAYLAQVRRCAIQIPIPVGDTASRATMQHFVAEARRTCDTPLAEVGAGVRIITADTLAVDRLGVSESAIDSAWTAAIHAGVSELPSHVVRTGAPTTDFTYVIEFRRGRDYRASAIEYVERPETEADRQVQQIYAAVNRLLPPERVLKP